MSFALYICGFLVMIAGLAWGAYYLHIAPHWIAVGVVVMLGIGIVAGVARTRQRDPS